MATVVIYHNVQQRDASLGLNARLESSTEEPGYTRIVTPKSHALVRVFEYALPTRGEFGSDMDILEHAFSTFNIGVDEVAQAYRDRNLRSLSVGDVVSINGRFYSCDSANWKLQNASDLNVIDNFDPIAEYGVMGVTVPL